MADVVYTLVMVPLHHMYLIGLGYVGDIQHAGHVSLKEAGILHLAV